MTRRRVPRGWLHSPDLTRAVALATVGILLGAALQVLFHFIDVVGVPVRFLGLVVGSLAAATLLARVLSARVAVVAGALMLVLGLGWYLARLPNDPPVAALLADTVGLLNGRSLLQIANVRTWVLAVTPAPVFLTWYFALRRHYPAAVAVAGATLGFLVLTGDADALTTLIGVVAGVAALGVGDFDRRGDPVLEAETVLVVVSLMIVVPSVVTVVPLAAGAPDGSDAGAGGGTLEASLLNTGDEVSVQGPISLSPEVRFTVRSDESRYWRVASFDRYTGDGWVSTGQPRNYEGGQLSSPPGEAESLVQQFRAEMVVSILPAAWKPVRTNRVNGTQVAADGSFATSEPLREGEEYTVESAVVDPEPDALRAAGTDYPDGLQERYTQLPASTPDRVERRTGQLTAAADTPYDTARVVESWLENNRNYSLDVEAPTGNVADEFLFERTAGYCTYFATTMVTMLRSQDIPARFVVGYTPGERVGDDERLVRGLNSHAWVEVYFPGHGWVQFDPTPAGPREDANFRRVQAARANNASDVDTNQSLQTGEWARTPTPFGESAGNVTVTAGQLDPVSGGAATTVAPSGASSDDGGVVPELPSRRHLVLGLVSVVGAAVGVRRTRLFDRAYRRVWVRYQPREEPASDVERAFQRLLYLLERRHDRARRPTETVAEYLDAVGAGSEARRVADIRERTRYRGEVSQDLADEAVRLVGDLAESDR